MKILFGTIIAFLILGASTVSAQSIITFDLDSETLIPGEIVTLSGTVDASMIGKPVGVEIKDSEGKIILIRTITPDSNGEFSLKFKVPQSTSAGKMDVVTNIEHEGQAFSESLSVDVTAPVIQSVAQPEPEPIIEEIVDVNEPICGEGTILQDGICVVAQKESKSESKGGGCLIATATFGSELAPQVQQLRELRDNSLITTVSGSSFMTGFNSLYYSFSPAIADYERENPAFKEAVKITITPLLTSLSLLNYVDIDSEASVLGYGIGIILMNVSMYFITPAVLIWQVRKRF